MPSLAACMQSVDLHLKLIDKFEAIMVPALSDDRKRAGSDEGVVNKKQKKVVRRKYKAKAVEETSPLGVLKHEINLLMKSDSLNESDITNDMVGILNEPEVASTYHRQVTNVEIRQLSSNGDGLAVIPHPTNEAGRQIIQVPFGLPGDIVTVRVFKTHPMYAESDLLSVDLPSKLRDDLLINCRYFGKCSGCQFQNVNYDQQLVFKKETIQNAYAHFAPKLTEAKQLPQVDSTEPSPLQYEYRTKLTPHFNVPYKKPENMPLPPLGFGAKGRPEWRQTSGGTSSILDIEECSIGTPIVNIGMKNERIRFANEFNKYKKGATILLREDTGDDSNERIGSTNEEGQVSKITESDRVKTCVTNSRQIVREVVGGRQFEFSAGEFFQNNNSILPAVLHYVRSNLSISDTEDNYLVDAYCGSGLFSISCSDNVKKVIGVEVSADSVKFAERNAANNNISNVKFIVGKAEEIFKDIDTPPQQTSVILDPPRKGCDDVFLNQLSAYNPVKIVYISCNVHSQARDVEWFLNNTINGANYKVESIKGFDFFPQTHHVESVAVLVRV